MLIGAHRRAIQIANGPRWHVANAAATRRFAVDGSREGGSPGRPPSGLQRRCASLERKGRTVPGRDGAGDRRYRPTTSKRLIRQAFRQGVLLATRKPSGMLVLRERGFEPDGLRLQARQVARQQRLHRRRIAKLRVRPVGRFVKRSEADRAPVQDQRERGENRYRGPKRGLAAPLGEIDRRFGRLNPGPGM